MPKVNQLLETARSGSRAENASCPFDRDLPPAVTIDSGNTVRLRTLDSGWGIEKRSKLGTPRKKFPEFDRDRDGGHALIGPVEVRGAEPGMSL